MKCLFTICLIIILSTFTLAQKSLPPKTSSSNIKVLEFLWKKANKFNRDLDSHSTLLDDSPKNLSQIGKSSPHLITAKGYKYSIKIKNSGDKKIKQVQWNVEFIDPLTLEKIDTHQFISEINISPGKVKKLVKFSISPPTKIIDAALAEKSGEPSYKEIVFIKRVVYSDGSIWNSN